MSARADALPIFRALRALADRHVTAEEARIVAAEFAGFCDEWCGLGEWSWAQLNHEFGVLGIDPADFIMDASVEAPGQANA